MFPSNAPLLCLIALIGVFAIIALGLIVTQNPLFLAGLLVLHQFIPPIINRDAEPEEEPNGIGFTADIE